jgi:hypothetical protein
MTTQAPEANETVTVTGKEIGERISERAGPVPEMTIRVSWFPLIDAISGGSILDRCAEGERAGIQASMKPTTIQFGQPCPFAKEQTVAGIFDDENEYRVYAMGGDALSRFRLSKSARLYSVAKMEVDAFVDAIVDEIVELRDGISSAEAERAAVLEYGEAMAEPGDHAPYTLQEFLEDLKEGVHLEDDDEQDEDPPKLTVVPDLPKPISGSGAAVPTVPQSVLTVSDVTRDVP